MKNRIINYALCLITLVSTLVALPYLPSSVPMHFDINGAVDRYGSKYEMLLLPAVLVLLNVLAEFGLLRVRLNGRDPESRAVKSDGENAKITSITTTAISFVIMIMNFALIYIAHSSAENLGNLPFDFTGLSAVALGIVFVVMGNYMPKTRRNSLIGMRTVWSMYNDVTWQKSNRFAAYALVFAGIVTALSGLIFGGMLSLVVLLGSLVIVSVIITIYSYRVYRKEKNNEN